MKILAQQGFGPSDKVSTGLEEEHIGGVVLSPRYLKPERMQEHVDQHWENAEHVLMDPEYYATRFIRRSVDTNLGSLEDWSYFKLPRRPKLISGEAIRPIVERVLLAQKRLGLEEWIAPNVYVESADSIDAAVALNFVLQAKAIAEQIDPSVPVLATLVLDRDASMAGESFREILDALTAIDTPPDGYYLLVGSGSARAADTGLRSDLFQEQVIAAWMYMNYVLSINGARVINGYCHLMSPLLGACGGEAAASGWFSGLREFSLSKYIRTAGGGRYPLVRYLSVPLLSRIKHTDYENYRSVVPEVVNDLSYDSCFDGAEPTRTEEAVQSWEALTYLARESESLDVESALNDLREKIEEALRLWDELRNAGFMQEIEPNVERLEAMRAGIKLFERWAELA